MRLGIVGCGYVAFLYVKAMRLSRELSILGVTDIDEDRGKKFASYFAVHFYSSVEEMLSDTRVELVVNLTNPASHFSVSKACLKAGKHVYSEKPLALSFEQAAELVRLADSQSLRISSAPSRLLGETAQTMWRALRDRVVDEVYLVYAETDDGPIHQMPYHKWINPLGTPWPHKDEFETGCTLEHAGYAVSLLAAFFGPIKKVTAFASLQVPSKLGLGDARTLGPDFSVACLEFSSGIVARLTCGTVASQDHSIRIFGSTGTLRTDNYWTPRSPVYVVRTLAIRRRLVSLPWKKRIRMVRPPVRLRTLFQKRFDRKKVDPTLGIVELIRSIKEGRPSRLSPQFCLHTDEVVLAINAAFEFGSSRDVTTTFESVPPLPWSL